MWGFIWHFWWKARGESGVTKGRVDGGDVWEEVLVPMRTLCALPTCLKCVQSWTYHRQVDLPSMLIAPRPKSLLLSTWLPDSFVLHQRTCLIHTQGSFHIPGATLNHWGTDMDWKIPRCVISRWNNSEAYSTSSSEFWRVIATLADSNYQSGYFLGFLHSQSHFHPKALFESCQICFKNVQTKILFWTCFWVFLEDFEQGHNTNVSLFKDLSGFSLKWQSAWFSAWKMCNIIRDL